MSANKNHPKKGSRITVSPIRKIKDIKKIKRKLRRKPRDLLLFTLGVNNGLRISDLLNLRVGDVRDLAPGETLKILERKTGKGNVLMVYFLESAGQRRRTCRVRCFNPCFNGILSSI